MRFARNYVRHRVLPLLRAVNPRTEAALTRLADITSVDRDYLELEYERCVTPHIRNEHGRICISRDIFSQLHPALQRRCIQNAALLVGAQDVGYEHVVRAIEISVKGKPEL